MRGSAGSRSTVALTGEEDLDRVAFRGGGPWVGRTWQRVPMRRKPAAGDACRSTPAGKPLDRERSAMVLSEPPPVGFAAQRCGEQRPISTQCAASFGSGPAHIWHNGSTPVFPKFSEGFAGFHFSCCFLFRFFVFIIG